MEYHYQIGDIKIEVKRFFNYENYGEDYDSIRLLHRVLSNKGNKEIYNIANDNFFKGQKDYLCTIEKDFKILKNKSRYKKQKINNTKLQKENDSNGIEESFISKIKGNIKNKYFYKFNRYKYY